MRPEGLQIKEYLIPVENLPLDNEESRQIDDDDWLLGNIFLTIAKNRMGLTCKQPELIFATNRPRFNCTAVINWVDFTNDLEIHMVRGAITHAEALQPHLTGKSTFLDNFELLDEHISLEVIGNSTKDESLHDILLEKFKNLKPIESAAISVGC